MSFSFSLTLPVSFLDNQTDVYTQEILKETATEYIKNQQPYFVLQTHLKSGQTELYDGYHAVRQLFTYKRTTSPFNRGEVTSFAIYRINNLANKTMERMAVFKDMDQIPSLKTTSGRDGFKKDHPKLNHLLKVITANDLNQDSSIRGLERFYLGLCYRKGNKKFEIDQNLDKAKEWFQLSSEDRCLPAFNALAILALRKSDFSEAKKNLDLGQQLIDSSEKDTFLSKHITNLEKLQTLFSKLQKSSSKEEEKTTAPSSTKKRQTTSSKTKKKEEKTATTVSPMKRRSISS